MRATPRLMMRVERHARIEFYIIMMRCLRAAVSPPGTLPPPPPMIRPRDATKMLSPPDQTSPDAPDDLREILAIRCLMLLLITMREFIC